VRVGKTTDPAEREADRAADAVVRSLGGQRDGTADALMSPATTRIQRTGQPTIRRSVYLFNEDDSIYKDTEHDNLELAFIQKLGANSIFIEYGAIERVRKTGAFKGVVLKYLPVKPKAKVVKPEEALGVSSSGISKAAVKEKAEKRRAKNKAKAEADELSGADRSSDIRGDVIAAVKAQTPEGKELVEALGKVFVYDREDGEFAIADIDLKFLAVIISDALFRGPSQMRTGGGSRLPAAMGLLWVQGADGLAREQILQVIGVPANEIDKYKRVGVKHVDWATYQAKAGEVGGSNSYEFASPDGKIRAIYTSFVETARGSNSRIQVAGTAYTVDNDFLAVSPASDKGQKIQAAYGTLGPATADSGWIAGTGLNARDRGVGQTGAMGGWNALGAAAYGNVFLGRTYDLTQNWEWLHIRGAQLGGVTNGTNLVAGQYITNSAMIPFEAMIERWARADPTKFEARFLAHGINGAFCTRIELRIRATGHSQLGNLPESVLASFDPVSGKLVDKLAGEFMKRAIDQRVRA
jgi:hypothetical protein